MSAPSLKVQIERLEAELAAYRDAFQALMATKVELAAMVEGQPTREQLVIEVATLREALAWSSVVPSYQGERNKLITAALRGRSRTRSSTCIVCKLPYADCACILDDDTMRERALIDAGVVALAGWSEERRREHEIRSLRAVTTGYGARDEDFDAPSMTAWQRNLDAEAMRDLLR